jgi:hypothetical protein
VKRIFSSVGGLLLGLALSITSGCGGDLAGVKMKDSLNKNPDKESSSQKPAPPLAASDRTAMLFNELNRIQRTLQNLTSPPPSSGESGEGKSCVRYVSTPKEKGIFLVARYEKCHWTQELSGEKAAFVFAYRGREEYTANGEKSQARVALKMMTARASAPRTPVAKMRAEHTVTTVGKDKIKTVTADSVYGAAAQTTADYSKITVTDGEWLQTGARALMMKRGSALSWIYRPAGKTKGSPSPSFKIILSANEDIAFGTQCPWPIKGSFELREVDQSGNDVISDVEVNAKGYTGKDKVMHPWPTDHCLGL